MADKSGESNNSETENPDDEVKLKVPRRCKQIANHTQGASKQILCMSGTSDSDEDRPGCHSGTDPVTDDVAREPKRQSKQKTKCTRYMDPSKQVLDCTTDINDGNRHKMSLLHLQYHPHAT